MWGVAGRGGIAALLGRASCSETLFCGELLSLWGALLLSEGSGGVGLPGCL